MKNTQEKNKIEFIGNCNICGDSAITLSLEKESFVYGSGQESVTLSVDVPVHHCAKCKNSFTEEDASDIRHNAVCKHLGIYTPNEIRTLREKYHLSQSEFSEITKIGKASLARWEGGVLIQNLSNDNLLYLLSFPDNLAKLKNKRLTSDPSQMKNSMNIIPFTPKFRAINSNDIDEIKNEAAMFQLYPIAMKG